MSKEKPAIFINYRRALSTLEARFLYLMLDFRFPGEVFIDEETLEAGDRWRPKIQACIQHCKVMISVIPDGWVGYLDSTGLQSKLYFDKKCHVRNEIEAALKANKIIVPILVNGAKQPAASQLPKPIRDMFETFNNGVALDFRKNPEVTAFEKIFKQIAQKAGLEVEQSANSNLFRIPLDKDFPLPTGLADFAPESSIPFVGLKPFKREDARIFFGRSREIYELCHKVLRDNKPRLLLLDGYSGTGKSSLLQAGLIPRVEKAGWTVVYGRREENKIEGLPAVFRSLIEKAAGQSGENKLIILDQVEEAVYDPIANLPDELERLAANIREAILKHTNWKIILGFRSEEKERIKRVLQNEGLIFDEANTLRPLNHVGVEEAIHGVVADSGLNTHYRLQFQPDDLYRELAQRLHQGWEHYHIAPLLQVNMEMLWERCQQPDGSVLITEDKLVGLVKRQDELLDHYLKLVRQDLSEAEADDQKLLDLLQFYVKSEPVSATRLQSEFDQEERFKKDPTYQRALEILRQRYLLLDVNLPSGGEGKATRLSHDVLARVIRKRYDQLSQVVFEKFDERTNALFNELKNNLHAQMYQLQYPEAHDTLQELVALNVRWKDLEPYLRELLFFWSEATRVEKAAEVAQWWLSSKLLSDTQASALRQLPLHDYLSIRNWLAAENPEAFGELFKKYYAPADEVMVTIPGGKLKIGEGEETRPVEVHSFRLANTPTTWWKYGIYLFAEGQEAELTQKAPNWGLHGDHPAVNVNWYEVVEYCNWLSDKMGLEKVYDVDKSRDDPGNQNTDHDKLRWGVTRNFAAKGFRLPTEVEWEFAARGGLKSKGFQYAGSDDLKLVGWYSENSNGKTHPVGGQLHHNELRLYDMSGNVWEWCQDWYDKYPTSLPFEYSGQEKGTGRVLRGGCWANDDFLCQVAHRVRDIPDIRSFGVGFRVALGLLSQGVFEKFDERINALFEELNSKLEAQIHQLQYQEAHATLQDLVTLNVRWKDMKPYLREMLFFWSEAKRTEKVAEVVQWWLSIKLLSDESADALGQLPLHDFQLVRAWLASENQESFAELFKKYYAPADEVMVTIPGGKLKIGEGEETRPVEVHSFRLANTPTTWWKYGLYLFAEGQEAELIQKAPNWGLHGDHPSVNINWHEAVKYCNWLSDRMGLKRKNGFRLPSEVEWEFAARGGLESESFKYAGSNNLKKVGWYRNNSEGKTHRVGQFQHNELHLFDMSGNVQEWCQDWYDRYPISLPVNYVGSNKGTVRVLRGGSWDGFDFWCRVAHRNRNNPNNRNNNVGFRPAQDLITL